MQIFQKMKYLIMLMLVSLLVACSGDSPESVVKKYIKFAEIEDIDSMVELVYLEGYEQKAHFHKYKTNLQGRIKQHFAESGSTVPKIKSLKTSLVEADKREAKVRVDFKFDNGEEVKTVYPLMKLDGKWKVLERDWSAEYSNEKHAIK